MGIFKQNTPGESLLKPNDLTKNSLGSANNQKPRLLKHTDLICINLRPPPNPVNDVFPRPQCRGDPTSRSPPPPRPR